MSMYFRVTALPHAVAVWSRSQLKEAREPGTRCSIGVSSADIKKETPSLRELRIFLKAVDDISVPFEGGPTEGKASPEERARVMGEMMNRTLKALLTV